MQEEKYYVEIENYIKRNETNKKRENGYVAKFC